MKIAHIVSTFPPRIGGMGQVAFEEAKGLADLGHEVTVFTPRFNNSSFDFDFDFKIVYLKSALVSANGAWLPQLGKKLVDFDIVHLHFPFYVSAHYVYRACKKNNKQKFVVTYHMDAQVSGWQKVVQNLYDKYINKKIFDSASKIITLDQDHLKNSLCNDLIKQQKVVEIVNGVDTKVFKPLSEINTELKTILFVGNLLPFKRFDLLLEALSILKDDQIKIKVVGGGYKINEYKHLAMKYQILNQIEFVGAVIDRSVLAKYYNQASCLAVTSDSGESFSLAAVEAMSCGCPVVASNIPGVRGRVENGKTGWLFESGSASDLAEKLKKVLVLSTAERMQISERARQLAVAKYDWSLHNNKLENVYKSIM